MLQVVTETTVGSIEEVFLHYCNESANIALVISGQALSVMLDNLQLKSMLLKRAFYAKVVIVARVSPKQKQQVVALVKEYLPKAYTLAIGDGANDVSMINEAHVGVGIQGVEGTQAARAADFAIQEFKHLKRLMFYYGVECSRRNALTILYIFLRTRCSSLLTFGLDSSMALVGNTYTINGSLNYLTQSLLLYLRCSMLSLMKCTLLLNTYNGARHHIIYLKINLMSMFSLDNNQFYYYQILALGFQWNGSRLDHISSLHIFNRELKYGQWYDNGIFEDGVFIYGIIILLVNLKVLTFTYTNYNFTIFFIVLSILVYWLILILVNDYELSPSFNFYRYLVSPQLYLALALTCMLFLFDLAIERFYDFQIYVRKPESIELV